MKLEYLNTTKKYTSYKLIDSNGNHIATIYEHSNRVNINFMKLSPEFVKILPNRAKVQLFNVREDNDDR